MRSEREREKDRNIAALWQEQLPLWPAVLSPHRERYFQNKVRADVCRQKRGTFPAAPAASDDMTTATPTTRTAHHPLLPNHNSRRLSDAAFSPLSSLLSSLLSSASKRQLFVPAFKGSLSLTLICSSRLTGYPSPPCAAGAAGGEKTPTPTHQETHPDPVRTRTSTRSRGTSPAHAVS